MSFVFEYDFKRNMLHERKKKHHNKMIELFILTHPSQYKDDCDNYVKYHDERQLPLENLNLDYSNNFENSVNNETDFSHVTDSMNLYNNYVNNYDLNQNKKKDALKKLYDYLENIENTNNEQNIDKNEDIYMTNQEDDEDEEIEMVNQEDDAENDLQNLENETNHLINEINNMPNVNQEQENSNNLTNNENNENNLTNNENNENNLTNNENNEMLENISNDKKHIEKLMNNIKTIHELVNKNYEQMKKIKNEADEIKNVN